MIGILDYGMGNLRSVANAFISQGGNPTLVRSKAEMDKLTHLVIPGVGAFKQDKDNLEKLNLVEPIIDSSIIFLLNKAIHGIDAFYEVELPDIFLFIHPIGTVLGRGKYNDYLIVYQRCGVGSNHDLYPILGKYVTMHPGSSVLGNSKIGDRCSLAAESMIVDKNLEEGSVYFGTPKQCRIRSSNKISYFWK
jgi:hypothetical protein